MMKHGRLGRAAAAAFASARGSYAGFGATQYRACGSPSGLHAPATATPCSIETTTLYHPNGVNGTNGSAAASSVETLALLRAEVDMLRDELQRRDVLIATLRERVHALEAAEPRKPAAAEDEQVSPAASSPPAFPEGATVVATTSEFENAVARHCPIIALAAGSHVRSAGVSVSDGDHVTIVGPRSCSFADRPVLEGHLAVKGAHSKLVLADVEVRAPSRADPCVAVASAGHAELSNVTLCNGRDGVYLSGKGTAALADCLVAGNTRGLMEMQRCRATFANCTFDGNLFHCVLLASPQTVMAPKTARVHEDAAANGNTFSGGRCDVALSYNPMEDRCGETYRGAKPIALTEEESTANLIDESW